MGVLRGGERSEVSAANRGERAAVVSPQSMGNPEPSAMKALIVAQIRRDMQALDDPWLTSEWWRDFYLARIAAYQEWAREIDADCGTGDGLRPVGRP